MWLVVIQTTTVIQFGNSLFHAAQRTPKYNTTGLQGISTK